MSFAALAGKLGPALKSLARNPKMQKALSGPGGLEGGYKDKATLKSMQRAMKKGKLSQAGYERELHSKFNPLESLKITAKTGGSASGLDPSAAPIRSTLSGFFDPKTQTGRATQSFLGSGTAAQIENQLTQKAIAAGVRSAPQIVKGAVGLPMMRGVKPSSPISLAAGLGGQAAGQAAFGGRMLATAGGLTGSEAGSAVGSELSESAGAIAKNFKDIARNPINPANWAKLAQTVATLPIKFQKLGESLIQANEKLAPFSAAMAQASMEFKMAEVGRNIQSAQATGNTARFMTSEISELKDSIQPLKDEITNIANIILGNIAEALTQVVEFAKGILGFMGGISKAVNGIAEHFLGEGFVSGFVKGVTLGMLDYDDKKEQAKNPIALSLGMMKTQFSGGNTMIKSNIGDWDTRTNNGTRADGTIGGDFNSPIDPNSDLTGQNDMG